MKPLKYLDYQRAKWEGVRRADPLDPEPGFEAVGRAEGAAVSYMGPHGYRGPCIELPPLGWAPLGDVISVPAGKWVDMVTRTSNAYGERRGVRDGRSVRLPSGVMGRVPYVPRTTCADIGRALGGGGWAATIAKKSLYKAVGTSISATALPERDPLAIRLIQMQRALRLDCTDPNAAYPLNDEFWVLVRRLAIELDSRKARPTTWTLMVESVSESWDEFIEDLPVPDFPGMGLGLGKLMLYSALGFGAYLLLKGKGKR